MDLKIVDKDGWIVTFPVEEDENGCLNFTGYIVKHGYGEVRYRWKKWYTHRLIWMLTNGPIPEGIFICHKCDNRRCVNIDHLYAGDNSTNMYDAAERGRHYQSKKTHCKHGHEFTPENTRYDKTVAGFQRTCRECDRLRYYRKKG
ncbi:MAG TPA: HNH endonuclease signature motif containing protein [Candidatus Saccharimonadales bacterium]|nr:HNH endonuclease signature motif containing protein [Candidatus Saccharimonadales bacterium]